MSSLRRSSQAIAEAHLVRDAVLHPERILRLRSERDSLHSALEWAAALPHIRDPEVYAETRAALRDLLATIARGDEREQRKEKP